MNDRDLVKAYYYKENTEAINQLFKKYIRIGVNFLVYDFGADSDEADEIVQKVLKNAFIKKKYDPNKKASPGWYFKKALRNEFFSRRRSAALFQKLQGNIIRNSNKWLTSGHSPEFGEKTFKAALESMSPPRNQIEIAHLFYYNSLTQEEIAKKLGYSLGHIRNELSRFKRWRRNHPKKTQMFLEKLRLWTH